MNMGTNKIRIATVVGTRPELIRLSRIIHKFDEYFDHTLIHTGQNFNFELNEIFFSDLEIKKPDYYLNAAGDSPFETIGNIISTLGDLLPKLSLDAIFFLGDTNSCLGAIVAKRLKIPVFHFEAGNRCYDMRVPEEINRKLVDHIADVNLTYSHIARDNLLSEGLPPELVINVGSPMMEVLSFYDNKIQNSTILKKLNLKELNYYVVSTHREENVDSPSNFLSWVSLINSLATKDQIPIIISTHPRLRKRIEKNEVKFHKLVTLIDPLGFTDYVSLQKYAKVVLSDSGTLSEESSILNFPALNLRHVQERHEAFEEGAVMMVGLDFSRVCQALLVLKNQSRGEARQISLVRDYQSKNVSDKITRIVISYVDYINRVTWKKY
jgi:UDP-N-acetyl-L-fucosamine synthase